MISTLLMPGGEWWWVSGSLSVADVMYAAVACRSGLSRASR
ncbi:MAG: hypothetical protein ACYTF3_02545 [Planctomycetota bacterium]|jgi:hypothetical protein